MSLDTATGDGGVKVLQFVPSEKVLGTFDSSPNDMIDDTTGDISSATACEISDSIILAVLSNPKQVPIPSISN